MSDLMVALAGAFWLGILTAISPCPLATNVAAISYVAKRVARPSQVLVSGLLYTFGRTISYVSIAFIAVKSLVSTPQLAMFLQNHMNRFLGPILIIAGVFLLDVIPWPWVGNNRLAARIQPHVEKLGIFGALFLGIFFAMTFCPVSAALFFGSLVPLAIKYDSSIGMPIGFGIGTALPVVIFSALIGFATHRVSKMFNFLTKTERWMRRATAIAFFVVGAYYCMMYLFGIL